MPSDSLKIVLTFKPVLLGAQAVAVADGAAQVEHGEHGDNHHDTLQQQGEFKLLADPAPSPTHKEENRTRVQ